MLPSQYPERTIRRRLSRSVSCSILSGTELNPIAVVLIMPCVFPQEILDMILAHIDDMKTLAKCMLAHRLFVDGARRILYDNALIMGSSDTLPSVHQHLKKWPESPPYVRELIIIGPAKEMLPTPICLCVLDTIIANFPLCNSLVCKDTVWRACSCYREDGTALAHVTRLKAVELNHVYFAAMYHDFTARLPRLQQLFWHHPTPMAVVDFKQYFIPTTHSVSTCTELQLGGPTPYTAAVLRGHILAASESVRRLFICGTREEWCAYTLIFSSMSSLTIMLYMQPEAIARVSFPSLSPFRPVESWRILSSESASRIGLNGVL